MISMKPDIRIVWKGQLGFIKESGRQLRRFKPSLGDAFSFLYDRIMTSSVFPKKSGADVGRHYELLSSELSDMRDKPTLEVGTGTAKEAQYRRFFTQKPSSRRSATITDFRFTPSPARTVRCSTSSRRRPNRDRSQSACRVAHAPVLSTYSHGSPHPFRARCVCCLFDS